MVPRMHTTTAPTGRRVAGTTSTVLLIGFLTVIPLAYGGSLLLSPGDGVPWAVPVWVVVGALAAAWGGTLVTSTVAALAGIAFGQVGYGVLSRLFSNTPWLMAPDRFAIDYAVTVVVALASVAAGFIAWRLIRGQAPFAGATPRAAVLVPAMAVLVVGGGTLFANLIAAVIPFGANRPTIEFTTAGVTVTPASWATGPLYWTLDNVDLVDAEFAVFRIASDEELALRLTGEMGGTYDTGSREVGWYALGAPESRIQPGQSLDPGRYLVLVVETLPENHELGEEADRVVIDDLYAEFTVTE